MRSSSTRTAINFRRKTLCCLFAARHLPLSLVRYVVARWCYARSGNMETRGIRISFGPFASVSAEECLAFANQAIEALQGVSPINGRRVLREIQMIQITQLPHIASFHRLGRFVCIDWNRLCLHAREEQIPKHAALAAILVHEAVHGRLARNHFPASRWTLDRMEGICVRLTWRFLLLFGQHEVQRARRGMEKSRRPGWRRP